MTLFYVGLSYGSIQNSELHQEGRRILRCLDQQASPVESPLEIENGGRPYFGDHHADFSISHTKQAVAVSYLTSDPAPAGPLFRTGCDIQYLQPQKSSGALGSFFFHASERDFLAASASEAEGLHRFFRIWVLKEAYLKIRGLSVFDMRRCPAFSFDDPAAGKYGFPEDDTEATNLEFFLYETGSYALGVCREIGEAGISLEPEVRWFSPETLPLNRVAKIKAAVSSVKP
ncbi:MAG: 4'-phosphopantetheinyl transferase superfamily protein [Treponema sp.]|jgi:hypothetical protein|nr:4'-phosphopantetheinyl transferase superfamily protein [Treponema sp.]